MVRSIFQKGLALLLILLIPVFVFFNYTLLKSKKDISSSFSREFLHEAPMPVERSFVFVLPFMGKGSLKEQTLASIFSQKYENFRVILIDASGEKDALQPIYHLAHRFNKEHLISVVPNYSKIQIIDSFYSAIHSCRDDEIVIQIDSHDWLAHENVVERINQAYFNESVWLTYSQCLEYPSLKKGKVRPYMRQKLRKPKAEKIPWISSPFKTYYAGLFKQIEPDGRFGYKPHRVENNLDLYMVPMVRMSEKHIRFIDDVLYVHNNRDSRSYTVKVEE